MAIAQLLAFERPEEDRDIRLRDLPDLGADTRGII
jgi:hypothetical protein